MTKPPPPTTATEMIHFRLGLIFKLTVRRTITMNDWTYGRMMPS